MEWINTTYILLTFKKIFFEYFIEKFVLGIGLGLASFFFDGSLVHQMNAILGMVALHFVVGLIRARKEKKAFDEAKVFATVVKLAVYGICVSAGFLAEKIIGLEMALDNSIMGFIAIAELIAILKSAASIGFPVPGWFIQKVEGFVDDSKVK